MKSQKVWFSMRESATWLGGKSLRSSDRSSSSSSSALPSTLGSPSNLRTPAPIANGVDYITESRGGISSLSSSVWLTIGRSFSSSTRRIITVSQVERASTASVRGLKDLVTFEGCDDLLRGTRLTTCLRGAGRLFVNSAGSSATYELSTQVLELDGFISHNWSVPRYAKFAALTFHFFFARAVAIAAVVMVGLGVLSFYRFVPLVHETEDQHQVGILGRLLSTPVFMLCLLGFADVSHLLGCRGPVCFLDKTCICQTDDEAKRTGIRKLGAFIANSQTMIVLFTDEYLKKLWTVYEVAAFLALHHAKDLCLVPTSAATFCITYSCACFLVQLVSLCVGYFRVAQWYFALVVYIVGLPILIVALCEMSKQKRRIWSTIEHFSVAQTVCFDEDDRPIVYNNISMLMRCILDLSDDASQEEALAEFDLLARSKLRAVFTRRLGHFWFGYWHCLAFSLLIHGPMVIDLLPSSSDVHPRQFLVRMLRQGSWFFFGSPLVLLALQWLADMASVYEGRRGLAALVAALLIVWSFVGVIDAAMGAASYLFMESSGAVAGFAVVDFILFVATFVVYLRERSNLTSSIDADILEATKVRNPSATGQRYTNTADDGRQTMGVIDGSSGIYFEANSEPPSPRQSSAEFSVCTDALVVLPPATRQLTFAQL